MPTFPATIKRLDAATFEEEFENVAASGGEMDGGYVISRPRFTRAPRRTWNFRFVEMRDTDKKALEDFWKLVKGSSNGFDWQHPISKTTINVRFGPDMKLRFKRIGFGKINIWESDTVTLVEI